MKLLSLLVLFQISSLWALQVPYHFQEKLNSDWDNGYEESRYHFVLDEFIDYWSPRVEMLGGELKIYRDWSDGAVNAWAERNGRLYILEVPGGMARYHLIREEGFVLVLCHELGHLIGGSPSRKKTISYEGQADYFSTHKCASSFLEKIAPLKSGKVDLDSRGVREAEDLCLTSEIPFCEGILKGVLGLTTYYAKIVRKRTPLFSTQDQSKVKKTLAGHPSAQCRMDTMTAGLFCPERRDLLPSFSNDEKTWCHKGLFIKFKRPRCWYLGKNRR